MPDGKYTYLDELINDLRSANDNFRHTRLYKTLKYELSQLGYWKAKERGNARKGGIIRQQQLSNE